MATALRTERTSPALPEQKRTSKRPASSLLSDFMVQHEDDAAIRTIQQHMSWTLEAEDRNVFVQALLNPPAPGTRLRAAARRYKSRLSREPRSLAAK